jgi:hypothetical protein
MYDGGKIMTGLIIFIGIATYPFLYNQGIAGKKPEPKIDTPAIKALAEADRKCVEPKAFMIPEHMKLLNEWRDAALRDGKRTYVSSTGKKYEISLQNGCMKCHSNKKQFCDQCHLYMNVNPYCWDCHLVPKEPKPGEPAQVTAPQEAAPAAAQPAEGTPPAESPGPPQTAEPKES